MSEKLYIIDGHSQIFRAYYAPFRDLTSPTGEPTRATYVFCSMLLKFVRTHRPKYLVMAVDGPTEKLLRRKVYSDYKVTRKPKPEDLPVQISRIYQIVQAMGIPVVRAEGYEADDILATLVEQLASAEMQVVLVSRDKDLDQLAGNNVVLYDPMKDEIITAADIERTKGYPPSKAIEVQSLTGDTIDNIPGIPGVGPKTAAKLIAKYGSAEAVLQHAEEQTPKLCENLKIHAEKIALARKLVTLDRNVPLELSLADMKFTGITDAIRPIFAELGFNRLIDQLDSLGVGGDVALDVEALASQKGETTAADFDYTCIDTAEGLDKLISELEGIDKLAIDTETTSVRPMDAKLVGISLCWESHRAVYLPVKGPLGAVTLDIEHVRQKLSGILDDESIQKIGQNLKYDLIVLQNAGFHISGKLFDTMIAAHVLDSSRKTYKLDALAAEMLHHRCIPIEELIGRGRNQTTMDAIPVETVAIYAAEDADVTFRLAAVLEEQLTAENLTELFANLEMPLLPVLTEMERTGIALDSDRLKDMHVELSKQTDVLRDRIIASAGRTFNVDSPKQLSVILFEDIKLPVIKRTKTGASTDSSVLEELASLHELPGLVLEYRKLTKLLSTYLTALAASINPRTGRVHTSFHQAGTVTGRLSSSNPNLQNIPIRTDEGRKIRSAFVADEGCVLLSADYSQVELRVLAHFCEDPTLMRTFEADQDIHRIVAAEVFDVSPEEVTSKQRSRAKTVNFGIIYGQTAFGLARTLWISRKEARDFILRYRNRFPKIDEFLHICIEQAKSQGYVETIFGRRRRIFAIGIDSRNPQQRALAERLAINSVIQGSAADLIKQAMLNIAERIRNENRHSRMLLQIHDELLFEIPTDCVEDEKEMIVSEMTGAIKLRVPLKVDVGIGLNWMDAK